MNIIRKQAQAGFTLIELIVVIVILGILAATALPRMFDMSGQARLAKMQAALGAVKASAATAHAAWLMNGGQLGCTACVTGGQVASLVVAEGQTIPTIGGYPDVGGDGHVNAAGATTVGASGIAIAANLTSPDYVTTTNTPGTTTATNNTFTVTPDVGHPDCRFTYTEAVQTDPALGTAPTVTSAPTYNVAGLTIGTCD